MDTYELQQGHILWSGDREIDNQIKRIINKQGKIVSVGFKQKSHNRGAASLAVSYDLLYIGE